MFEIFLLYHVREYVSYIVLVLYMCALEWLKKDHLTIITAFHNICVYKSAACIITSIWKTISKIRKPVSNETFVEASKVINLHSFILWSYCNFYYHNTLQYGLQNNNIILYITMYWDILRYTAVLSSVNLDTPASYYLCG